MEDRNDDVVPYFGQPLRVACDRNCAKAWGWNCRPSIQLSEDEDDIEWLADDELGEAPADPGTYEGGYGKPTSPDDFPTKWCVRQCERCTRSRVNVWTPPLALPDWNKRKKNVSEEFER